MLNPEDEERIQKIEKLLNASLDVLKRQMDLHTKNIREALQNNARFLALESIAEELAAHEGISPEQFSKHINERARIYHDQLLQNAEDKEPNLAGELDQRSPDEIPDSKSFPPLFP